MRNKVYKIYMALLNEKIIASHDFYIVTVNIRDNIYHIWCKDGWGRPRLFDFCTGRDELNFKWSIIMGKGEL